MVHHPVATPEQGGDPPVTVPAEPGGQPNNVVGEGLLVIPDQRLMAMGLAGTAPAPCVTSALKLRMSPSRAGCTGGDGWGSEVSLSCLFYFLVVRGQFGLCLLQPAVFGFQLLQAPCLIDPEAAVLGLPRDRGSAPRHRCTGRPQQQHYLRR